MARKNFNQAGRIFFPIFVDSPFCIAPTTKHTERENPSQRCGRRTANRTGVLVSEACMRKEDLDKKTDTEIAATNDGPFDAHWPEEDLDALQKETQQEQKNEKEFFRREDRQKQTRGQDNTGPALPIAEML